MKQRNLILGTTILFAILFLINKNNTLSQVKDVDGNTYKTVKIGNQVWMAENLNVEHYSNGDPIPYVEDNYEWSRLKTGAWCYYLWDSENGKIYGKLYNWYAVNDSRGLAPKGWHIPDFKEWDEMINYLGGNNIAGEKLKNCGGWNKDNGTNLSGFSAFPGGYRNEKGKFFGLEQYTGFWASGYTDNDLRFAYWLESPRENGETIYRNRHNVEYGFSVRCLK